MPPTPGSAHSTFHTPSSRKQCVPGKCVQTRVVFGQRKKVSATACYAQPISFSTSFAATAHVARGQTLQEGVIADLCVRPGSACFTAYVTLTRGREDLLILRPFKLDNFQKGVGVGRELLLRQLRGEFIDCWPHIVKSARAEIAGNESKATPLRKASGNASIRTGCVARVCNILPT